VRGSRPCASPSAIAGFAPVASIGTVGGAFDWLDRHFALASLARWAHGGLDWRADADSDALWNWLSPSRASLTGVTAR